MGQTPNVDDLFTQLRNLQYQVAELSKRSPIASTVRGKIEVVDASGVVKVRIGQLASGGYGLEVVGSGGVLTTLSDYIFGPQVATVATEEHHTGSTYADLATAGPSVTLNISTAGRVLAMFGCKASWSDATSNGAMGAFASIEVSGANTIAAADTVRVGHYSQMGNTTWNYADQYAAMIHVFSGLSPGSTTFKMKYRGYDGTKDCYFSDRTIAVSYF